MKTRTRRRLRTGTALLLGATASLAPVLTTAADAAAEPGQSIWNDYGQSAAEVTAEVTKQVNATPSVIKARAAVAAAKAALTKASNAERAARAALQKAKRSGNKARIAAAQRAYNAAVKRLAAAKAALTAAQKRLGAVIAAVTRTVRARHYRPVDGTWLGDTAQYFIPDLGLEPIQVQISVYNGHVSDVQVPVYTSTGESASYNAMALPTLTTEAMAAHDTATVASVTGATLTSEAFHKSLLSALTKAGWKY